MELKPLPFHSALDQYQRQAEELLAAHQAGDAQAVRVFHENHPRFLDPKIPWLPKRLAESEIRGATLGLADGQLALARGYCFESWAALTEFVEAVTQNDSPVYRFEAAVEAVIGGDLAALKSLLSQHPELVKSRSTRVTSFDPPVHRATLLHYMAANGVEGYRQKTPKNAVDISRTLLEAGADVDALADLYGGQCTTMSLLVSSSHPAEAGVQVAMIDTLVDFGAALDARGSGDWVSPLITALVFGFADAAEALVRRGAAVDGLAAAAGLGRFDDATKLLPLATPENRHRALALASQHGRVEVVQLLLDAGEDADRCNPEGMHAHSTPLHQAVFAGRGEKWSDCWWSAELAWILRTRSTRARRWDGRHTRGRSRLPSTCAAAEPRRPKSLGGKPERGPTEQNHLSHSSRILRFSRYESQSDPFNHHRLLRSGAAGERCHQRSGGSGQAP